MSSHDQIKAAVHKYNNIEDDLAKNYQATASKIILASGALIAIILLVFSYFFGANPIMEDRLIFFGILIGFATLLFTTALSRSRIYAKFVAFVARLFWSKKMREEIQREKENAKKFLDLYWNKLHKMRGTKDHGELMKKVDKIILE